MYVSRGERGELRVPLCPLRGKMCQFSPCLLQLCLQLPHSLLALHRSVSVLFSCPLQGLPLLPSLPLVLGEREGGEGVERVSWIKACMLVECSPRLQSVPIPHRAAFFPLKRVVLCAVVWLPSLALYVQQFIHGLTTLLPENLARFLIRRLGWFLPKGLHYYHNFGHPDHHFCLPQNSCHTSWRSVCRSANSWSLFSSSSSRLCVCIISDCSSTSFLPSSSCRPWRQHSHTHTVEPPNNGHVGTIILSIVQRLSLLRK